ncbi:MAG: MlaD family protein [Candidatus Omnitrophota bacterium]|jgi:phospholipid/cholesterol/gamma-HCH transport system substrate-binding protein
MIFGRTKLELKLGIFVFIGLAIFVVAILSVGGVKTWASGYQVNFMFNFINGVKKGAPVRFAGVDVGQVQSIVFFYDDKEAKTKIRVTCWVDKNVKIPMDSVIWVNTLGLLGEKYVEIMPGVGYDKCLLAKGELAGEDPLAMNDILKSAKNVVDNLDTGIDRILNKEGSVGKILYDDKLYNNLDALVTDLRKNPWKLFWKAKERK